MSMARQKIILLACYVESGHSVCDYGLAKIIFLLGHTQNRTYGYVCVVCIVARLNFAFYTGSA